MSYKKIWEVPSVKIGPPDERTIQMIFSPQIDENIQNINVLMSTLSARTGRTGLHTHPVDEIMYVMSGSGEGIDGDTTFKLESGVIIYAPAGIQHECRNLSEESMQLFCVFVPALPEHLVKKFIKFEH